MVPAANVDFPWQPDLGDGTYQNPVLYADYSDPDVIRVGDDFYLTASSFNCTPGLPLLHSRDLVNWTLIGHALKNVPDARYAQVQPGCGVWAPAIRHHDGQFWIFFPTPDEGIYVTTAKQITGPWSEPHLLLPGKGIIDPCPLWDDDGKAYLIHAYAGSRAGIKNKLHIRPMSPDGRQIIGDGKIIYDNPQVHPTLEGPKFLKKDGWYYILAPGGQVAAGWQVAFRSREIYGPYDYRVVLDQGTSPVNGPHQGALIDTPTGEWWFLHFQELQPYGRIVHLQPVQWRDGWPWMGEQFDADGTGQPVMRHRKPVVSPNNKPVIPQASDEFDTSNLGLQWQWHANHCEEWHSLTARPGHLRLFAQPITRLDQSPALLLQKFAARMFAVETVVDCSTDATIHAGLVVMGREFSALQVERSGAQLRVVYRVNENVASEAIVPAGRVELQLRVGDGGYCTFAYAAGNEPFRAFSHRFRAMEGVWIGAKFGVYALADRVSATAFADFDYVRVLPLAKASRCVRPV